MDKYPKIPILYPFYLLIASCYMVFVIFPQRIIGIWWCDECKRKFNFKQERFEEEACGYDGCYVIATRCGDCEAIRVE